MYIDLKRIALNASEISETSPLLAVIKADAYGMGAVKVAQTLSGKVRGFAVWTGAEADELLKVGIKDDILILCQTKHSVFCENIVQTVFNVDDVLTTANNRIAVKINTGMNRMGIDVKNLDAVLSCVSHSGKRLDSVYTHLFCTDNREITYKQVRLFDKLTDGIQVNRHVAASGALDYDFAAKYDYVRCGLALYSNAVNVYAKIIRLRHLKKGEYAGYGDKPLEKNSNIAVINIGYRDGYRQLTCARFVFAGGKKCRIIGVCMDVTLVDVSSVDVSENDVVEILGKNITARELGASYGTSAYEAYTFLNRVRKIYVE